MSREEHEAINGYDRYGTRNEYDGHGAYEAAEARNARKDGADARPPGSSWTDAQWQAIVAGGQNILVAAAAGSGKTAVLVERIIRKIAGHTDVDRLLVATFTKAAASEMKERIRTALEKALDADPSAEHVRRQLALIHRASITTLHSFCLDVIRRHYALIGLDPGFRIANETEAELLKIEVLDKLFEEKYTAAEGRNHQQDAFLWLAEAFGGERGDEPLYRLVQQLYEFSRSDPWPEHWLRETAKAYGLQSIEELSSSEWVSSLRTLVLLKVEEAQALLGQAVEICFEPGGPAAYAETIVQERQMLQLLEQALRATPWPSWREAFIPVAFGRLKAVKGAETDASLQEEVKRLREGAKDAVAELAGELFVRSPAEYLAELRALAEPIETLTELTVQFGIRYQTAKQARGLVDFADLEHYCLRILREPASTPTSVAPSVAALEYRAQFDEILLDEYQDTNRVQEAIVSLIAREGAGNRFMVGDVKQSIYRFRLAEPNLFLEKYKEYELADASGPDARGLRIDLARNFRSRLQVVNGVNHVFSSVMREAVAELDYDERAALVCGAAYPQAAEDQSRYRIELTLLERDEADEGEAAEGAAGAAAEEAGEGEGKGSVAPEDVADVQTAQLEARWIAAKLQALRNGTEHEPPFQVTDARSGAQRPLQWRDVVILLRATQAWAPTLIEELRAQGIPAYAELSTGYFDAIEVEVLLSLLRVLDNPYQDIPLAGVLRSPIGGLNEEELALVRIHAGGGRMPFYEAVVAAADNDVLAPALAKKLAAFIRQLDDWRTVARHEALPALISNIYLTSGYYDFVGGLPGGVQRQANLRALRDRASQFEATAQSGLFRFLRYLDRMKESGGDLGTARAIGEQEEVVRIMSIHKSKGLEFPVVFVAGVGKRFNVQDLNRPFLMHKTLGLGSRFVDPERRVAYPTLPYLAIRSQMRKELLAEEMRVLYVALTRPKEKLYLVGTVGSVARELQRARQGGETVARIPDYQLAAARRYVDWLLPLLHESASNEEAIDERVGTKDALYWSSCPAHAFVQEAAAAVEQGNERLEQLLEQLQNTDLGGNSGADPGADLGADRNLPGDKQPQPQSVAAAQVAERLAWQDPKPLLSQMAAKVSVTELKRLHEQTLAQEEPVVAYPFLEEAGFVLPPSAVVADASRTHTNRSQPNHAARGHLRLNRPRFMGEEAMTAAERGTIHHVFMQHVPLGPEPLHAEHLAAVRDRMVASEIIREEQAEALDLHKIAAFLAGPLGSRLRLAPKIARETPFSCLLPAATVYPDLPAERLGEEHILIQGVIDVWFEDDQGLVLLDYKTDRIWQQGSEQQAEKHRFQLRLYADALGSILGRPVDECHVYFFDGGQSVQLFQGRSSGT